MTKNYPDLEISPELAAGIQAYGNRIAAMGGYGARVRDTMPDGAVKEGVLMERGKCQPGLRDDDGRVWRVNLDTVAVLAR